MKCIGVSCWLLCWLVLSVTKAQAGVRNRATECFNGTRFVLFLVERTFEEAKSDCDSVDATLARVSNKHEHDVLVELFAWSNSGDNIGFWIGSELTAESIFKQSGLVSGDEDAVVGPNTGQSQDGLTERLKFVDNSLDDLEFSAIPGEFPWRDAEPNDDDSVDDCVRYSNLHIF